MAAETKYSLEAAEEADRPGRVMMEPMAPPTPLLLAEFAWVAEFRREPGAALETSSILFQSGRM